MPRNGERGLRSRRRLGRSRRLGWLGRSNGTRGQMSFQRSVCFPTFASTPVEGSWEQVRLAEPGTSLIQKDLYKSNRFSNRRFAPPQFGRVIP